MDVAGWLRNLGLECYEAAFRENDVSADLLHQLTAEDLKELGVAAVGHRRRLLAAARHASHFAGLQGDTDDHVASTSAGERRQLTVMFCDLVGSTALSEKLDPEELRSLLHAYRVLCGDVIARYDGFVARYVGDGILTYFGWPTAHEEDAERAVRAALEIVQTVQRASSTEDLSVHIGIATGSVVVGEPAGAADRSEQAVGSTPNLAARLQGLATADQIVIAASTRRLVGNAFELTDLGKHDLKGIAEPVHSWRVERALLSESRFDAYHGGGALTPLVGREGEVDLLLRRWSQAKLGEGQVVMLWGEPGIGKSRILGALRQRLETQGVLALRFQCSPYYVNSALWPIIDTFERTLKFSRDETADSKLDKLEALIVTQYGRPLADVRFVASILSFPCEERYGALPMTAQKYKEETLRALVDLTEAAARQQPSVMLFEDAHWADPSTLEMLDLLIDRVRIVPLLVVLTHRPEFQSRWSEHGHVGALNLSKLTRAQSAAMVSTLAGGKALPAVLLEQILTRTDGVPLFVEELTKSVLESGELKEVEDHYEYGGSARAVTIPATLRDSLMARLDRFMPVKEIAQIGAAIGREFNYELIAAVAPMPRTQLDNALAQLSESGLAFRRGTPPDAIYTFKHALVQDAAHDSLLRSRRQELHTKIAQILEVNFAETVRSQPEMLAHHYTEARQPEQAVNWWHRAGLRSTQTAAYSEALDQLNCALAQLALLPESADRDRQETKIRTDLATPLVGIGGYASEATRANFERKVALYERTKEDALFPLLRGQLSLAYGGSYMIQAVTIGEQLFAVAEKTGERGLRLLSRWLFGMALMGRGRLESALQTLESGLAMSDPAADAALADTYSADPRIASLAYRALVLQQLGFIDQAAAADAVSVTEALQSRHSVTISLALTLRITLQLLRCDHAALVISATELSKHAQRQASQPLQATSSAILGLLRAEREPDERIFAEVCQTIETIRAGGWNLIVGWLSLLDAKICLGHGRIEAAGSTLDRLQEVIEPRGHDFFMPELHRLRADLAIRTGAADGVAEAHLRRAMELAFEQQARLIALRSATDLARLLRDQGRRREALAVLGPLYDWFTEGAGTFDLEQARNVLETLPPTES